MIIHLINLVANECDIQAAIKQKIYESVSLL